MSLSDRFAGLSEKELIKEAKRNSHAFAYLYEIYVDRIHNYIFYRTFDRELTEDLTHEVFRKVLLKIRDYQYKGYPFSAWIFRIARNIVIDFYRKNKKKEISLELVERKLSSNEDFSSRVIQKEEERRVFEAMGKLNDRQKEVLSLRYKEEFSNKEIAQILGKSEGAVKAIVHRAIENLRKELKEDD